MQKKKMQIIVKAKKILEIIIVFVNLKLKQDNKQTNKRKHEQTRFNLILIIYRT